MRRAVLLLAMLFVISSAAAVEANEPNCAHVAQYGGGCSTATLGTDAVDLGASITKPGTGGTTQPRGGGDGGANTSPPAQGAPQTCNRPPCREAFTITGPPAPPTTPVTLSDIASFRPVVGSSLMEPNGWIVTGLHTNFYSNARTHVVDGTLLAFPASVRFTAASWRWDYGDGATRVASSPGESWASLGVGEFDPTPTSHVFAVPGTYEIELTIGFTAEYRFAGQGWTPIAGTLTVPANRLTAVAGDASTVLVGRDCAVNPRGPGC